MPVVRIGLRQPIPEALRDRIRFWRGDCGALYQRHLHLRNRTRFQVHKRCVGTYEFLCLGSELIFFRLEMLYPE